MLEDNKKKLIHFYRCGLFLLYYTISWIFATNADNVVVKTLLSFNGEPQTVVVFYKRRFNEQTIVDTDPNLDEICFLSRFLGGMTVVEGVVVVEEVVVETLHATSLQQPMATTLTTTPATTSATATATTPATTKKETTIATPTAHPAPHLYNSKSTSIARDWA